MTRPDHSTLSDAAIDALIDAAMQDAAHPHAALEARIIADAQMDIRQRPARLHPMPLAALLGASMAAGLALGLFLPDGALPSLQTPAANTTELLAFADGYQEVYYDN